MQDIKLKEYSFENLPLLKRLRKELLSKKPAVCIERAKYFTEYLRDMASAEESAEIRYANAAKYFLSRKAPLFFDDNLLAGTTTSKPFGAPVYPEWTGMTIWPELDTISTREKNPLILSKEEAKELNFDIYPYWMERNILEHTRKKYNNPECMGIFERIVFFIASKAGCISHTVPYYMTALDKGVEYIIKQAALEEIKLKNYENISKENKRKLEFYQAIQIAMKGVIAYAQNLGKKAAGLAEKEQDSFKKKNFQKMAEVCNQVPAKPARTFREAINSIWLIQVAIHAENINMAMSPGRLDQILNKYYKEDIDKGILTVKEAKELVGCFWLKLNGNTNLVPETQEILPSPLLSSFFEGPMESGKDLIFGGALYNSSGATHIGFADTVDSLNAIEKGVFLDKKCSFDELTKALEKNFAGYEKLHAYLFNKTPKYGTEDPVAKKNARNLIRFLYDFYQSHTNYRGGKYRPGYWTMTNHAGQGKLSGALPNGRKANQVFAGGITPVSQAAKDFSTCLKAVGELESVCIPGGEALNLKYPFVEGKEDIKIFGQAVEAYFRYGGLHIQFNIMSYEDLIDARDNPDKYPELIIRVSGYSAYFNDLNKAMKDEIITRTAYNIRSGKAIPFPKSKVGS